MSLISVLTRPRANRLLVAAAALTTSAAPLVAAATATPAAASTPGYQVNNLAAYAIAVQLQDYRIWFHEAPLAINPTLNQLATQHSAAMSLAGSIYHSNLAVIGDAVPNWTRVGENVGYGPTPAAVSYAFAHSAPHLANMLGSYDQVGVGVVSRGDELFVTEEFAQA